MFTTMLAAVLGLAQVQATQPAAMAADSPERAYADFTAAVRAGRIDDALKLAAPIAAVHREFFAAQYRLLHEIESLKAAATKRFPGEEAEMAFQSTGMVSAAAVATAQATVVGDVAMLTMIAPDIRQREATSINLIRVDGRWLVSPFDAIATGLTDEEEKESLADAAKLKREAADYEMAAKQIAALRPRLDKDEFADADAVSRAMMAATMSR